MNEIITKEKVDIKDLIYEVREMQVMLDNDVAMLFGYETKDLNRNVKNNIERFPKNYCFQLTNTEYENLRCKNSTSSLKNKKYGGRRYLPYAFTEYGITMLAGILKSKEAVNASLRIVNTFIEMRRYIASNNYEKRLSNVESILISHNNKFDEIFNKLDKQVNNHIFFEGQIYDSFSLLLDIFESSKKSIIIFDNYADKKLLDILSKTKKEVIVYSKNYNKELIEKYKKQYNNVILKENNSFHDRFIIIDNITLYRCGASFKELGAKCFGINKIENKIILKEILERIE